MNKTAINPSPWSQQLGFDQAELVDAPRRQLFCSGQDAVDEHGEPQHPGDLDAQLEMALDNLEGVLAAADMTLDDVVRLNVYATDLDELFKRWSRVTDRFGTSRFATTLLGVAQLPAPGLLVLLEATAVD